jgi:Flp pilus assembly pilin Flp
MAVVLSSRLVKGEVSASSGLTRKRGHRALDRKAPLEMIDVLLRPLVRLQIAVAELNEREDGQTTTEYAILLGFLAIAIIIALFFLRNVLRDLFSDAASSVSGAPG